MMHSTLNGKNLRLPIFGLLVVGLAIAAAILAGCTMREVSRNPYDDHISLKRDPELARQLQAQATQLLKERGPGSYAEAETLLRRALVADIYNGPAHNNLGIILLERGELYNAASEFEWARKQMPGHPDPRVNLAITLERAGKTDEALSAYDAALAVYDGYLPAVKGKASLQIRIGRTDEKTIALLEQIALGSRQLWRDWAILWKTKLAHINHSAVKD